jgi:glycosyltransferase involved in cell wall biosynthesis
MTAGERNFVVATPHRSVCDDNARALEAAGKLRFLALGTRNGTKGIPPERTRLNPTIGLVAYICARTMSTYRAEWCRFGLLPWFDRWVRGQLQPGDHLLSSFGYTATSFEWVQRSGGKTFLDAGNSHIDNYWEVVSEEHRRWKCSYPPFAPHWRTLSQRSLEHTDYVLSPSSWVTESFLARGFRPNQIIKNVYPVDLTQFTPASTPRPADRPLRIISTGQLSLRKGTPYLLEAFRKLLKVEPAAELWLTSLIADSIKPVLKQYSDLPIHWAPPLPHSQLAERLRQADIFVLPSIEEGMARTVSEAMACGLPVVVTHNTGTADLVQPEISGTIVPVRDSDAILTGICFWADRIRARKEAPVRLLDPDLLSFDRFASSFISQLHGLDLV